jgi:hypothetical protein
MSWTNSDRSCLPDLMGIGELGAKTENPLKLKRRTERFGPWREQVLQPNLGHTGRARRRLLKEAVDPTETLPGNLLC